MRIAKKKKRAGQYAGAPGGYARAMKLTPARRKEIAEKAAAIRWKQRKDKP